MSSTPESLTYIDPEDDDRLLHELTPTFERQLDRHLGITGEGKSGEWIPDHFIPFDVGKTFKPGEVWTPETLPIPESVRSSLIVGVLTEDNLPWYTEEINKAARGNEALHTWNGRWTAEEWRHGYTLHSLLSVSRLVDPVALERDRMVQMETGVIPHSTRAIDGIAYVTFQELATQISHRNSGKITQEKIEETVTDELPQEEKERRLIIGQAALEIMNRVAKDETMHYTFYRAAIDEALKIDPTSTVKAIYRQLSEFEMPGTGIRGFQRHAYRIAKAWIYNPHIHNEQIVQPLMKRWNIDSLEGLNEEGKRSQEALLDLVEGIGATATKFATRFPEEEARTD
ncbi:acyl-ACP desaturase [Candidatus Saccharibacteria bacterium]|nr:acyl-ACP desaturase [Candidatus Saccharibacteria bacterium]